MPVHLKEQGASLFVLLAKRLSTEKALSRILCTASSAHRDESRGISNIEQALWPAELQAASARLIRKAGSPCSKPAPWRP